MRSQLSKHSPQGWQLGRSLGGMSRVSTWHNTVMYRERVETHLVARAEWPLLHVAQPALVTLHPADTCRTKL